MHFNGNKKRRLRTRQAQLLAGYQMADFLRRERVSDLIKTQQVNQHYHELNAQYNKQNQYIRVQLYRVAMMVERLTEAKQWVSASEHNHIHTSRQHWVDALCKSRQMIHRCQEYMSLFARQIDDHVAHLTGLDLALATFVTELCQFNHDFTPFMKYNDGEVDRFMFPTN